jgi:hypothetical protein
MNIAQRGLILLIRGYQLTVSPILTAALGPSSHCRFQPTCSRYAAEALRQHGVFIGVWLTAKRLARCHPWGKFGDDPVPHGVKAPDSALTVSELGHCHHGS